MDYLLLTIRAPLQSWGTHAAVGELRPSADHPGRSALAGLLAAALGIRRDEPDALVALHQALRLAVRQDACHGRMTDYHTTQSPASTGKRVFRTRRDELVAQLNRNEAPGTILSRREYLLAAAFTACLWLEGDTGRSLDEMAAALKRPLLPLYFGRKSCPPGFPLLPWRVQATDVPEALARYDTFRKETLTSAGERHPASIATRIWSDVALDDPAHEMLLTVRDVLDDARRRQFTQRQEHVSLVPAVKPSNREAVHVHQQN